MVPDEEADYSIEGEVTKAAVDELLSLGTQESINELQELLANMSLVN